MRPVGYLLLGLTLLAPATAAADVRIDAGEVTVSTTRARAVVTRKPFRIRWEDGTGRTVLSQVLNNSPAPLTQLPAPDPQPGGGDTAEAAALYSPLTFMVGSTTDVLQPGGVWGGTYLLGTRQGTIHSAREVVDARAEGPGARLELSTSDPGRRVILTLAPQGTGAIRLSARVTPGEGVAEVSDAFASTPDEAFRGFGGRHNALDQRGSDFFNWAEGQNVSAGPFEPVTKLVPGNGGERYQFPNGPQAAYYPQALFVSSRPYGFFTPNTELLRFRLASDRPDAWHVSAAANSFEYVIAPGDAPEAMGTLTSITGRHRVPPEWAVGPMFDRLPIPFTQSAADYAAKVKDDIARFDRYGLPVTAYRIEGWKLLSSAGLEEMIAALRQRKINPLAYFRAFVSDDGAGTDEPGLFSEATGKGYVAKNAAGAPYVFPGNFFGPTAELDFTNPETRKWWEGRIHAALDLGIEGFMQDFGEQTQLDMRFANGETGATMHNRYPVVFHRTTREAIDSYKASHPGREPWFFTRAGYSGEPGSAAFENANFPGDNTTDWSRAFGIQAVIPDMLNRGIGGAFGFGTDIGGYFDYHTGATTKELFIRWAQVAALSPVMRLHGSANSGTHAPWTYDDETVAIYKGLSELHVAARPRILRLWKEAVRTGVPIARPLWLEFPGDAKAAEQDQQFMLGPDVLVAPVVTQGARSREVYFPKGCWRDANTGSTFEGPRTAKVDAPLERLPYFERCGSAAIASGRCLPRSLKSSNKGVGRVRVGLRRGVLVRRAGVAPEKSGKRSMRWCVVGGGRVLASLDRRGRAAVVVSSARGHKLRRVARGTKLRVARRAFKGRSLRVRPSLVVLRRGRAIVGVKRSRVRFVGAANRSALRSPRALRTQLRRLGL